MATPGECAAGRGRGCHSVRLPPRAHTRGVTFSNIYVGEESSRLSQRVWERGAAPRPREAWVHPSRVYVLRLYGTRITRALAALRILRELFLAVMQPCGTPPRKSRRAKQRAPTHTGAGDIAPYGGGRCGLFFFWVGARTPAARLPPESRLTPAAWKSPGQVGRRRARAEGGWAGVKMDDDTMQDDEFVQPRSNVVLVPRRLLVCCSRILLCSACWQLVWCC